MLPMTANMKHINFKFLLYDIRFWIIVFFLVRLIGITNPPLEVGHNWRQTTVTMVARNFLEVDNNIFYPRIDIAGEKTGITGMEFPIFNYIIYLISEVFGYQHWYGRLINLIISSLGLYFFYKLVIKYFEKKIAFYATIILTVSIWFQFSRKIMPDTFATSLMIASIYFAANYFENKKKEYFNLFLYFILFVLGVLSKLPIGYIMIVFILYLFNHNIAIRKKILFGTISIIGLIPIFFWYFYWVPHLVEKYDFSHFFMGKSIIIGFNEIILNLDITSKRFYDNAIKYTGFVVFCIGLIFSIIKKEKKIYIIFIVSFFSFLVIVFKSGFTFYHHNYYIIPFVPVMALVAGYGLAKLNFYKISWIILIVIVVEGVATQQHDFIVKEKEFKIINLEKDLDKIATRNDLILINSGGYPAPMYFSHRKGWILSNEEILIQKNVDDLILKGLKYIVILKRTFGTEIILNQYTQYINNQDYCIYKI